MKRYYVHYGETRDQYKLLYVETVKDKLAFLKEFPKAFPISFKKAMELARFSDKSGAYTLVMPAEFWDVPGDQAELVGLVRKGRVMCRKKLDKR